MCACTRPPLSKAIGEASWWSVETINGGGLSRVAASGLYPRTGLTHYRARPINIADTYTHTYFYTDMHPYKHMLSFPIYELVSKVLTKRTYETKGACSDPNACAAVAWYLYKSQATVRPQGRYFRIKQSL